MTNESTQDGNLDRRPSFRNAACCGSSSRQWPTPLHKMPTLGAFATEVHIQGCGKDAFLPAHPRSPTTRARAAFTRNCVPIGWEPDHFFCMTLSTLPTISASASDGRPMCTHLWKATTIFHNPRERISAKGVDITYVDTFGKMTVLTTSTTVHLPNLRECATVQRRGM